MSTKDDSDLPRPKREPDVTKDEVRDVLEDICSELTSGPTRSNYVTVNNIVSHEIMADHIGYDPDNKKASIVKSTKKCVGRILADDEDFERWGEFTYIWSG